jgi:hypothetical protein
MRYEVRWVLSAFVAMSGVTAKVELSEYRSSGECAEKQRSTNLRDTSTNQRETDRQCVVLL